MLAMARTKEASVTVPIPSYDDPDARALLSKFLLTQAIAMTLREEPLPKEGGLRLFHAFFLPAIPHVAFLRFGVGDTPNPLLAGEEGYVFHVETLKAFEQYRGNAPTDAAKPAALHFVFFRDGRVEIRSAILAYGEKERLVLPSWWEGINQIFQTLMTTFKNIQNETYSAGEHAAIRLHAFLRPSQPLESPPQDA